MNRIIVFLIVILSFLSCSLTPNSEIPIYPEILAYMQENEIDTILEVFTFVELNVEYITTTEWQLPITTFKKLKGSCKEFCSLTLYMLYLIGVEAEIIAVKTDNSLKLYSHSIIKLDGKLYDPQTGYREVTERYQQSIFFIPADIYDYFSRFTN
jgi:hypothetical protein